MQSMSYKKFKRGSSWFMPRKIRRKKKLLRGNGICTGLKNDKISKCGYREDVKMNPGQPNKGTEQRCKYKWVDFGQSKGA